MGSDLRFFSKRKGLYLEEINSPWREILHKGYKRVLPKGYKEECGGEQFYFIISGAVRLDFISILNGSGTSLYMGPGCLFNEIATLLGMRTGQFVFYCPVPTETWAFNVKLLYDEEFISEYPRLIKNLMQSLASKSSELLMSLIYTRLPSSLNKICATLLHLANSHQKISQYEMSILLGLHPTTIARHIRTLRKHGIIGTFTKTRLEVHDMSELERLAKL